MNDTHQNERIWNDVLGLVLFAAGAFASTLIVQALTQDPASAQVSAGTARMGYALLWAGGAIPVGMMSLACLILGAGQFLGYVGAQRVTRHLGGVLGVAVGVSVALGAISESAGGALGSTTGGFLVEPLSAPVAVLVGLGVACLMAWSAWLTPSRATAWEKAQEIEKPAVPLQSKADGVTTEESAALAFEGEPGAFPETTPSPYPEDVRIQGQIPEGAIALGAEETSNHEGAEEEHSGGYEGGETAPRGPQAAAGTESEGDALLLATQEGDGEPAGEDMALSEEAADLDAATAAATEDDLSTSTAAEDAPAADPEADSAEADEEQPNEGEEATGPKSDSEPDDSEAVSEEEEWEEEEYEEEEGEDEDDDEEEEHEDAAELEGDEEDEGEEEEEEDGEDEDEEEDGEEEYEEEDEDEEEDGEDEDEEEDGEEEYEDAAELEEEEEEGKSEPDPEAQGDLFGSDDESKEPEVILEPQAAPGEDREEVLMKAAELFLERGRVAVSLLQRQFQLDFEESCSILDELQEKGLIGPYMGGNQRDILLTRDQWLERISSPS